MKNNTATKAPKKSAALLTAIRNEQLARLGKVLGCKVSAVATRLRYLNLVVEPCSRCGGTGSYSWNAMTGSTCFLCSGARVTLPKAITDADVEVVAEAVAAGKLAPYVEDLRIRAETAKLAAALTKTWGDTNVATVYSGSWSNSNETMPEIYRRNSEMCDLVKKLEARATTVRTGKVAHDYTGGVHHPIPGDTIAAALAAVTAGLAAIVALDLSWEEIEALAPAAAVAKGKARKAAKVGA